MGILGARNEKQQKHLADCKGTWETRFELLILTIFMVTESGRLANQYQPKCHG